MSAGRDLLGDLGGLLDAVGITRVGDITGLDRLGVPVWVAYRPWSRSLSVSQGKGLTPEQARASAVFEAVELAAAERLMAERDASADELTSAGERVLDVARLPRRRYHRTFDAGKTVSWVRGVDLVTNQVVWVPWRWVSMDLTIDAPPWDEYFQVSSNGLAAGRTLPGALAHALCEVIERDATTRFFAADAATQASRRVHFDAAPPWFTLLRERAGDAGVGVAVWDATSEIGVPVVVCLLAELVPDELRPRAAAAGMGCDPDPEAALARAVTEAAQSRLTFIAGSRDDLQRRDFERTTRIPDLLSSAATVAGHDTDGRRYSVFSAREVELHSTAVAGEALGRLVWAGFREVVAVDLSTVDGIEPFSAVKVAVPGLADNSALHPDYAAEGDLVGVQ